MYNQRCNKTVFRQSSSTSKIQKNRARQESRLDETQRVRNIGNNIDLNEALLSTNIEPSLLDPSRDGFYARMKMLQNGASEIFNRINTTTTTENSNIIDENNLL